MATQQAAPSWEPSTTDVDMAEEDSPAILHPTPARAVPGRGSWRLTAGAAGVLLVVAGVAATVASLSEDGASNCEGPSCRAKADQLDKVLTMKQSTMQPSDCPTGYFGTTFNINGAGKEWSFGNMSDCASSCDKREGCKGFEFHDKNGRCGTYLNGYVLAGNQFHRWLTCIKEDGPAPTAAVSAEFTITGLNYEDLVADQEAKEAVEEVLAETVGERVGVDPGRVAVTLFSGSVQATTTVTADGRDQASNIGTSFTENGAVLSNDIKELLKTITSVMSHVNGDLAVSNPSVQIFGETTTAENVITTPAADGQTDAP